VKKNLPHKNQLPPGHGYAFALGVLALPGKGVFRPSCKSSWNVTYFYILLIVCSTTKL